MTSLLGPRDFVHSAVAGHRRYLHLQHIHFFPIWYIFNRLQIHGELFARLRERGKKIDRQQLRDIFFSIPPAALAESSRKLALLRASLGSIVYVQQLS